MDVADLLTKEPMCLSNGQVNRASPPQSRPYLTRQASLSYSQVGHDYYDAPKPGRPPRYETQPGHVPHDNPQSPLQPPKTVNFQLMLSNVPQHRARLPLRVQIKPTDTTGSIISTVKNFYGLYEGEGVSFENSNGITLIAQYENLIDQATVHVRVTNEIPTVIDTRHAHGAISPRKPRLDEPFKMLPPQPHSRPSSRSAKKRTESPLSGRGYRGGSARIQPGPAQADNDAANSFSDSDAGSVSVSSSRKAKAENVASAEISIDNIVEGGRRKRAKFESSELPLFIPPQVPMTASMSSVSPQRRTTNPNAASPMAYSNQYTFAYNQALPSPHSYGHGDYPSVGNSNGQLSAQGQSNGSRTRASIGHRPSRLSGGSTSGVLPTPDPTIGSVISDEDVALQLMRLGDATNFSHGRTSTSTLDDALSGKAEIASSADDSEDDSASEHGHKLPPLQSKPHELTNHDLGPAKKRQKFSESVLRTFDSADTSGEEYEDHRDGSFQGGSDEIVPDGFVDDIDQSKAKPIKLSKPRTSVQSKTQPKSRVPSFGKSKSKSSSSSKIPPSPYSIADSRKASSASSANFQHQLATDDDDLSSKPRCQRCRKSKKGCDRQRPCQRCIDAGIGIEGCISEDEGNGRKGKFGRHMGVSLKIVDNDHAPSFSRPAGGTPTGHVVGTLPIVDENKKRKR